MSSSLLVFTLAMASVMVSGAPNPQLIPTVTIPAVPTLEKRFDNARLTFYDAGLGACGIVNTDANHIVALNSAQWDNGAHCFQTITIMAEGRATTAMIMDECPGCPIDGLDLTRGLFDFFAPESVGVLSGSWVFD